MNMLTIHALLLIVLSVALTIVALSTDWTRHRRTVANVGYVAALAAASLVVHMLIMVAQFADIASGAFFAVYLVPIASLGLLALLCLNRRIDRRPTAWLVTNLVMTILITVLGGFYAMVGALGHMR